jgi:putative glutamine amidotransferase
MNTMTNTLTTTGATAVRKPLVLMSMGAQARNGHPYQVMTHKYISPIVDLADCAPVLVPTCFGRAHMDQYLDLVDGVYLTGAATNIDPVLYRQENATPDKPMDPDRDLFDIALIHAALARGLPFLGVCRGMQELNVALGGDLHQKIHELPGMNDHRDRPGADVEGQYADVHEVRLVPGTWFADLMQTQSFSVNSLHGQGLNRLGTGMESLAVAEDGLVEVVHMPDRGVFTLGVQWHPEWRAKENPHSIRIFKAFGDACRERSATHPISSDASRMPVNC